MHYLLLQMAIWHALEQPMKTGKKKENTWGFVHKNGVR